MSREERELRHHLRALARAVSLHIAALDGVMNHPESFDRGRKVAKLSNALELALDQAMHFGLGVPMDKLEKEKARHKA